MEKHPQKDEMPLAYFETAMELENPGPATYHVQPLAEAISPLVARNAADDGRLNMIPDSDCRGTIRLVALEVYHHEKRARIWHKNVSQICIAVSSSLPLAEPVFPF